MKPTLLRFLPLALIAAAPFATATTGAVGHHAAELRKLGRALGIETVVVTE